MKITKLWFVRNFVWKIFNNAFFSNTDCTAHFVFAQKLTKEQIVPSFGRDQLLLLWLLFFLPLSNSNLFLARSRLLMHFGAKFINIIATLRLVVYSSHSRFVGIFRSLPSDIYTTSVSLYLSRAWDQQKKSSVGLVIRRIEKKRGVLSSVHHNTTKVLVYSPTPRLPSRKKL